MLKVGGKFINEAAVTEAGFSEAGIFLVSFVGEDYIVFKGRDAEALSHWFDNVSVHLDAASGEEKEYADYRARGGEMPKNEWRDLTAEYHRLLPDPSIVVQERVVNLMSLLLL